MECKRTASLRRQLRRVGEEEGERMSITDELRKWGYGFCGDTHDVVTAIADRIDAEHERELAEQQDSLTVGMQPMTEENMAEGGWVRGPLDADGKMWRSGDMSDSNWGVIEGIAYEDGRWLVSGHDTSAPWIPADSIRHYHEPTVEDVLREFAEGLGVPVADSYIGAGAAQLRLAGGEDA